MHRKRISRCLPSIAPGLSFPRSLLSCACASSLCPLQGWDAQSLSLPRPASLFAVSTRELPRPKDRRLSSSSKHAKPSTPAESSPSGRPQIHVDRQSETDRKAGQERYKLGTKGESLVFLFSCLSISLFASLGISMSSWLRRSQRAARRKPSSLLHQQQQQSVETDCRCESFFQVFLSFRTGVD